MAVLLAVAYLIFVEAWRARQKCLASRPVVIKYKSAAELARFAPSKDDYPCLSVEPARAGNKRNQALHAEIRQCLVALNNDADIEQYEVDLRSGKFMLRKTDLFVADVMPLALTRAYGQWDGTSRAFGLGSNHNYDIFPYGDRFPYTYMNVLLADGSHVHYNRISEGTSYVDDVKEHRGTPPTVFDKSRIAWNKDHWDYTFADGRLYRFPEAYRSKRGAEGALVGMQDAAGDEIKLERDAARNLRSVTSPHGHWIRLTYDASNRISTATDNAGELRSYSYDQGGRLLEVRDKSGERLWRYDYELGDMTRVEASGKIILTVHYNGRRVESLELSADQIYHFDYLYNRRGDVVETTVREPSGKIGTFRF